MGSNLDLDDLPAGAGVGESPPLKPRTKLVEFRVACALERLLEFKKKQLAVLQEISTDLENINAQALASQLGWCVLRSNYQGLMSTIQDGTFLQRNREHVPLAKRFGASLKTAVIFESIPKAMEFMHEHKLIKRNYDIVPLYKLLKLSEKDALADQRKPQ